MQLYHKSEASGDGPAWVCGHWNGSPLSIGMRLRREVGAGEVRHYHPYREMLSSKARLTWRWKERWFRYAPAWLSWSSQENGIRSWRLVKLVRVGSLFRSDRNRMQSTRLNHQLKLLANNEKQPQRLITSRLSGFSLLA